MFESIKILKCGHEKKTLALRAEEVVILDRIIKKDDDVTSCENFLKAFY